MSRSGGRRSRALRTFAASILLSFCLQSSTNLLAVARPDAQQSSLSADDLEARLHAGEVVVDSQDVRGTKYVTGRIVIDETPESLWPVLVNPFEFQGRICHRMKRINVLTDQPTVSVINCKVGVVFPIPDLDYVVESHYTACKRIEFKRVRGSLRDFKGFWELKPFENNKTEVTYSMYLDPGFPVPEWIVRQGVRSELPSVLTGLRARIHSLKHCNGIPEKHNIAASAMPVHTL